MPEMNLSFNEHTTTKKIILATGGFDPIHSGHISYLNNARKLGDLLIVGVNSDEWLVRKKGNFFQTIAERLLIIRNLKMVDKVITFDDKDNSANDAIKKVKDTYPKDKIIFVNGGDRTKDNIPEMDWWGSDVEFVFGVGGNYKMNSSSFILSRWTKNA